MPIKNKSLKKAELQIKLLIVDDEELVASSLANIFSQDYQTLVANDYEQALVSLERYNPQVVVVDQGLQGKSGFELLEKMAVLKPETIRIIMTGHQDLEKINKGIKEGIIYYCLQKPLNIETLKNVVHRGALEYISELKHALLIETIKSKNKELLKKNQELQEINKSKSEFLGNLSHRIITPLTNILTKSQLLQLKPNLNLEQKNQEIKHIYSNAFKLSIIAQNMLILGKLETGHLKFKPQEFFLDNVFSQIVFGFEHLLEAKKLKIEVIKPTENLRFLADLDALILIFRNLLDNALVWAKENSSITLEITCAQGNFLKCRVHNFGPEIPNEMREHLFEQYYNYYHKLDQSKYIGLGLFVLKLLLTHLKGKIEFNSSNEKGTEFIFTFPYLEALSG